MGLSNLKRENGDPLLTSNQVEKLSVFDSETQYYLVQMIAQQGFDTVYDSLDKFLKEHLMILKTSVFDSARYQQHLNQQFFTQKIEAVKGVFKKCPRCRNDEATYYEKQTRSADEPMTYFITCTACGKTWKQ